MADTLSAITIGQEAAVVEASASKDERMKLVVHIGGAKCGSSAIQDFLRDNAEVMKSRGILIPSAELGSDGEILGQQLGFFEGLLKEGNAPHILFERLKLLSDHMQQRELHTAIISAENLFHNHGFHDILSRSQELFDVQILVYLRRQDDYLASAWQQWFLKTHSSFKEYVDDRVGRDANWAQLLAGWEKCFGIHRIIVRRFEHSNLVNGDVIDDLISVIRLDPDAYIRRTEPSNPSFDENLGALAYRIRDVFSSEHDNRFFEDMLSVIGPRTIKSYRGSILLSLEERRRILSAYEECNCTLKDKYFPDLDSGAPLFEPPSEADVVSLTELEQLRCQQDLLVRAILGLINRIRKLEQR